LHLWVFLMSEYVVKKMIEDSYMMPGAANASHGPTRTSTLATLDMKNEVRIGCKYALLRLAGNTDIISALLGVVLIHVIKVFGGRLFYVVVDLDLPFPRG
jgi:hypothetical protein